MPKEKRVKLTLSMDEARALRCLVKAAMEFRRRALPLDDGVGPGWDLASASDGLNRAIVDAGGASYRDVED